MASYTEDQLVTTNPQQLIELEKSKEEFNKQAGGGGEAAPAKK